MTGTQAISYPITLTPAELAFLLSLVDAQTLLGLEHEALFPESASARESLYLQGRSELEQDGWLSQVAGTERYDLNDPLVAVIAAMAAPRVIIVTTLDPPGQPRQSVTHYISTIVVEAVFDGHHYEVAGLRSTEIMLARLANTISLPQSSLPVEEFELSAEQARQIVAEPQIERLLKYGAPAAGARALTDVLQNVQKRASVHVMQVHFGQVTVVHRLQVLVSSKGSAWLAVPTADTGVRFKPTSDKDFAEVVQALIQTP